MELSAEQGAVLQTVSHFDVLDYPLTLLELHNFLTVSISLIGLMDILESSSLKTAISHQHGFYFLADREEILELRRKRYGLALNKLKIANFYARLLTYFPWVKAVAIYSSLSLKNSRPAGDLDFFIITKSNRVWSARFFINAFLKTFHLRPRPGRTANKVCISYLTDENNLDLSKVNFKDDYYYYYGTGAFTFLTGDQKVIDRFFTANNWLQQFLPNWQPIITQEEPSRHLTSRQWLEKLASLVKEESYRHYQLKLLPAKYRQTEDGEKVVLSAGLIKLHDNDKRLKYNQLFKDRFNAIIANLNPPYDA